MPPGVAGFVVHGLLFSDSMGQVFAAASKNGRVVHLRRIAPELASKPGFREALRVSAARVMALPPDDWLLATLAVDTDDDGHLCVVTEATHSSLSAYMTRTPNRGVALFVVRQVARALAAAHSASVVHGGVHPQSVYLDRRGHVRLGDFAVSSAMATLDDGGSMGGMRGYIAPELALGDAPDARSDVYAAGILLHNLLGAEPPPALPNVPAALLAVCQAAHDTDPARRYADGHAILGPLEHAASALGEERVSEADVAQWMDPNAKQDDLEADTAAFLADLAEPGDAKSGSDRVQLGKYQLIQRIAVGGMAEIFVACERQIAGTEKPLVIKRILPQLSSDQEFVTMFLDEARIAATLSHPNIVQMHGVDCIDGTHIITMEYLHGEDTRSLMKKLGKERGSLPVAHALHICIGVAAGLHHAHEKCALDGAALGIVHRDVTPQNVFITYDGAVKVLDFGIAKAANRFGQTEFGTLKGKIPYMSPEQCRAEPLDRRSDIYSIGILLYELTTGRRLYKGGSELNLMKQIVDEAVPSPMVNSPEYPAGLAAIVQKALAKDLGQRYQTALELQVDLEAFAQHEQISISAMELGGFLRQTFGDKEEPWRAAHVDPLPLLKVPPSAPVGRPSLIDESYDIVPEVSLGKRSGSGLGKIWLVVALIAVGGAGLVLEMKTDVFHPERRSELEAAAAKSRADHDEAVAAAKTAIGDVTVNSDPEAAAVWMLLGRTPCESVPLPVGQHVEIRIEHEGFQAEDIVITPDHWLGTDEDLRARVSAKLRPAKRRYIAPAAPPKPPLAQAEGKKGHGIAQIESDPPGAQAWLLVGFTPDVRVSSLRTDREVEFKLTLKGHAPGHALVRAKTWQNASGERGREASVFSELRPRSRHN